MTSASLNAGDKKSLETLNQMGKPGKRYVTKGVPGGWRIWNNLSKQWWGQLYERQPDELVSELNGQKRPDVITELTRRFQKDKR